MAKRKTVTVDAYIKEMERLKGQWDETMKGADGSKDDAFDRAFKFLMEQNK